MNLSLSRTRAPTSIRSSRGKTTITNYRTTEKPDYRIKLRSRFGSKYMGEQLASFGEGDMLYSVDGSGAAVLSPSKHRKSAYLPKAPTRPYLDPHLLTDPIDKFLLHWHGAKLMPLALSVGIGLALNFLVPKPAALTAQAWTGLSVFMTTIAGLVLGPLPVGAWAMACFSAGMALKAFSFQTVMASVTSEVIWVIALSALLAKSFETSGLGARVANLFVLAFGKTSLGLAYGLGIGELFVSAAIPAIAARAGGVFSPIIRLLSAAENSLPGQPSRKRLGTFLVASQLQTENHSSAFFFTGAANNLLCISLAATAGVVIENPYMTWLMASCVPALVGTLVVPLVAYRLMPPEVKEMPEAPKLAAERLKKMGPLSKAEWVVLSVLALCVSMWAAGSAIGVSAVATAMVGVTLLLQSGILKWSECLENNMAWDTIIWYSICLGFATSMNSLGVTSYFSGAMGAAIGSLGLSWGPVLLICNAAYYALHWLTASQAAHAGAFFIAFLSIAISAGAPPLLAALTLSFNTDVMGAITHFASAQAPVYLNSGFIEVKEIMEMGAEMTPVNIFAWAVVGPLWWKLIGLW